MFELKLGSNRSCDGVTRRDLLKVGSLSALGLGLPEYFRAKAVAGESESATDPRDFSCILIWLQGGISHIDSFDPKPDAPAEIRGEFGVIPTRVPGISICDPLPKLAQHQDKYSILRSLNPKNGSHGVADAYMLSGHPFNPALTFPSFGAVIARERGDRESMPPYIQLGNAIDQRFGGGVSGFLGDQFNPFVLPGDPSSPAFSVRDVTLPGGVDRGRFQHRMKVLHTVDTWQAQMESSSSALEAADTFYQKAFNLVTAPHAKKAFDLRSEDPRIRDRYGKNSLGHPWRLGHPPEQLRVAQESAPAGPRRCGLRPDPGPLRPRPARLDAGPRAQRFRADPEGQPFGGPGSLVDRRDRAPRRRGDQERPGRRPDERTRRTADRGTLLHRGSRRDDLSLSRHPPRHHPSDPGRTTDRRQLWRPSDPRACLNSGDQLPNLQDLMDSGDASLIG